MKRSIVNVVGTMMICSMIMLLVACTNPNGYESGLKNDAVERKESIAKEEINKKIMEDYITNFLTTGYEKYYIINSVTFEFGENRIQDESMVAIVLATMNYNVPLVADPDTIPYIKEAKEKAQKEIDPTKKKIFQNEYETLFKEYGKPQDGNFFFKVTANLIDEKIEENSIKLYLEQDAEDGVKYIPAEEILP